MKNRVTRAVGLSSVVVFAIVLLLPATSLTAGKKKQYRIDQLAIIFFRLKILARSSATADMIIETDFLFLT